MGSPRKIRSKFTGPSHPWRRTRIEAEKTIQKEYGLKNKKEIWKAASQIRRFTTQAKKLIGNRSAEQSKLEQKQLLDKLVNLGLLVHGSVLEDVLALTTKDLLDRRLQTLVFKKGFALTSDQARQFILHGHIQINGKKINIPSYFVSREEEFQISFNPLSALADAEHPERSKKKKEKKSEEKRIDENVAELKAIEEIEKVVGKVEE